MNSKSVTTRIAIGTTLAAAVALAGCASPKAANNANFTKAINTYYAEPENCASVRSIGDLTNGDFPVTVRNSSYTKPAVLNAMVKEGVLTARSVKNTGFGSDTSTEYSIAPSAKNVVTGGTVRGMFSSSTVLCVGHYAVKSIDTFTEPTPQNGMTASAVKFTRVVRDVPDWARSKAVVAAAKGKLDFIAKASDSQQLLVLTNKGWKVAK